MLKNLIKKKQPGNGDMIACFFVVLGLSATLLLSINFINDMFGIINVDQIARQGILLVETEGTLTSEDKLWIKNKLLASGAIDDSTLVIEVLDKNQNVIPSSKTAGYGNLITLHISCRLPRTHFYGLSIKRDYIDGASIERYKSSIAKY